MRDIAPTDRLPSRPHGPGPEETRDQKTPASDTHREHRLCPPKRLFHEPLLIDDVPQTPGAVVAP